MGNMRRDGRLRCVWLGALLASALAAQNVVTTIAGIDPVFNGQGQPAVNVPLGYVNGVATDSAGNVYFTDPLEHLVLRVAKDGTLAVVAGNGIAAYSGDGGPATSAAIAASDRPDQYAGPLFEDSLGGIVVDAQGNVFFGDSNRVRRVAPDGTITTIAGGGTQTPGDGGPATLASLGIVNGLTFDSAGNLYFTEGNRIRKMTADGTLSTYAGTGTNGFSGDGGPALAAQLSQPLGLAFDAQGNLYVADGDVLNFLSRIRVISANGTISTIAGGGSHFPADGAAPLSLDLSFASGLAVDAAGAVYVFAPSRGYLLKISGGSTTLVTGTQAKSFADNIPARSAYVVGQRAYDSSGIAFDSAGNLYAADSRDGRLCKIDTHGILTTVAGKGGYGFSGDGGPALGAAIQNPTDLTQAPNGTIYFLDTLNARVRAISPAGGITTVLSAANLPALGAIEILNGIASDAGGNVYVLLSRRVIELSPNGSIQVIVNQPNVTGDSGDGGAAAQAALQSVGGLARDAAGNMYISDPVSYRIRRVTTDGRIHTVAGTGAPGVSPDGAVAASSPLMMPTTLLADNQGGLYFVEVPAPSPLGSPVLRYITPDGHLKTIAGTGITSPFSGDGGPALQAGLALGYHTGLALDAAGNLYLSDSFHGRVRVIAPNGIINTFAGNGTVGTGGDGGPALNASFSVPRGLLLDAAGDLLITDVAANRIRAVLARPPAIAVSPSQMSFTAPAGGAGPAPQKLTVTSPVSGLAFSITKSAGADWLVLRTSAGVTPLLVNVRIDPSKLSPGSYQATLTISSPLGVPATTTVLILLQVTAAEHPELAVSRPALSFTFPSNSTSARTQQLRVFNLGSDTLSFTARAQTASGGNWLSVSPGSGAAAPQSPQTLSVTANPKGLAVGTYTGSIAVSGAGQSAGIRISLTVSKLDHAMQLSFTALSFTAVAGGGVVPPRRFTISNIGRGTMNFTVSTRTLSGGRWLSVTPESGSAISGTAPPTITVTANQAGLAPGFYFGLVRVDSPGSANTPQVASVAMHVLAQDQDPGPVIEPSEIVIHTQAGAPPPGSRTLSVYNVSATPQTYVSSVTAPTPGDLFSVAPDNATLSLTQPVRLVVQPLAGNLPAGVYNSELTLQFSDGYIRRVGIRTIVAPATAGATSHAQAAGRDAPRDAACAPTQLVPVITTLGQSFDVPAAWPVALESQVEDDCGNTLDSGNVTVTFSNGDPPLGLSSVSGGAWQGTWVSGQTTPVTITVTANDPSGKLTGSRDVTGALQDSSPAPLLNAAVSGASFAPNTPLAPGSLISLFGQNLANGTASAGSLPLGDVLAGASIEMAGALMPLVFAENGQVNAVVPAGINANTSQQILLQRDNTVAVPLSVDVAPAEPATFMAPVSGARDQGAILNALTYVLAEPATPARAGDILVIFCTGLGAVDRQVPDGAAAPASPPANTVVIPTVTIGGKNARVTFSGLSPGFAGLYQIDAVVPPGVAPGSQVPVVISISGQTSPPVTIAVK